MTTSIPVQNQRPFQRFINKLPTNLSIVPQDAFLEKISPQRDFLKAEQAHLRKTIALLVSTETLLPPNRNDARSRLKAIYRYDSNYRPSLEDTKRHAAWALGPHSLTQTKIQRAKNSQPST